MKGLRVCLLLAALLCLFSCKKDPAEPSPALLKEGTVKVTGVKVAGVNAIFDSATSTFTAVLPAVTDFTSLGVVFSSEAVVIRAGD